MYCHNCGAHNRDDAQVCVACGVPFINPYQSSQVALPGGGAPRHVPNYLAAAILSTVLCCPPFGIVAIVYAAQVDGKLAGGDYAGAVRSSESAKAWCWASFGVGLAVIVLYVVLALAGDRRR